MHLITYTDTFNAANFYVSVQSFEYFVSVTFVTVVTVGDCSIRVYILEPKRTQEKRSSGTHAIEALHILIKFLQPE